jgi:hypothetical protein
MPGVGLLSQATTKRQGDDDRRRREQLADQSGHPQAAGAVLC